jgi:hypothetical protein
MLEKLKEISNQSSNQKSNINNNHSNLQLLRSFYKSNKRIKNICFAAIMAASVTGCSSLSSNPYQTLPEKNNITSEITSEIVNPDLKGSDFYKALSAVDSEQLAHYETQREYFVDDIDAPIYTIDELSYQFKSGKLFENNETVYLKNPYEDDRLVKVTDAREMMVFSGFGKTYKAPMFMENPQLFSMREKDTKRGLEMGINLDVLDHKKMSSRAFKTMVFHELNHGSLAQEVIVHSHHESFTMSEISLQTKKLFGMDVSDDGAFYTRSLLESHSDISSLISLKIQEEMSSEELIRYLKNEIDNQAIFEMNEDNKSDEHRSLRGYEKMLKMLKDDPEVFDKIPLKEVPFYAVDIAFDAGFYMSEEVNSVRNYLDHRENFDNSVFLGSLSRDKLAFNFIVQQMGEETETTHQLRDVLNDVDTSRGLIFSRSSIEDTINDFKENGEKDPYYVSRFNEENTPYLVGLQKMKEEIDLEIKEKGYDKLLDKSKELFNKLEKEWRASYLPDNYKNSPLFSKI